MDQNARLESVRNLHKLDCKLITLRKKFEELPLSLQQLDRAVEEKQEALKEAGGQLTALRSRYDSKELELKSYEAEINKYEEQLGAVKTNKEYAAVLSEITTKKADIGKAEDEMLLVMDSVEQQESLIEQCRENDKLAVKDREEHKGDIAQQQREVEESLKEFNGRRDVVAATIASGLLHQYERILEKRGAGAVVPVVDNTCQGCFMKMTPEVQAQLLRNDEIIFCKFCSRIIYRE